MCDKKVKIRIADADDCAALMIYDVHISEDILAKSVADGNVIIAEIDGELVGWLRYNFFWDSIPFMNMLFLLDDYRCKGIGTMMVGYWERLVSEKGFDTVMTSTQANESSQHFYRKLGYSDLGGFIPMGEEFEIMLGKKLVRGKQLV